MEMYPVRSGNVDAVGYDETTQTLYVRFLTNKTYAYYGVHRDIFQSLLIAGSPGEFLADHVKGVYPYERVSL